MAEKALLHEIKNSGILAVYFPWKPFTQEEIEKLTRGVEKFALVDGGDHLYLYGGN